MLAALFFSACSADGRELILASTTSTQDSGLFDELLPVFSAAHPEVRVKVIAVGSGEALELGRRRDADVLLVHSPADEQAYMAAGHGRSRAYIMYNDFVIVGPAEDPARIAGMRSAVGALRWIAAARAPFISRGDSSGTHRRELILWDRAGVHAEHVDVGQGMGETLAVTSERAAYTLTDRATFMALRGGLQLRILVEGDTALLNRYSVITVAGARNQTDADAFADWLRSPAARAVIRDYGVDRFGAPLFHPAP